MYLDPRSYNPDGYPPGTWNGYYQVHIGGLMGYRVSSITVNGVIAEPNSLSVVVGPFIGNPATTQTITGIVIGSVSGQPIIDGEPTWYDWTDTQSVEVRKSAPYTAPIWTTIEPLSVERKNRSVVIVVNDPMPFDTDDTHYSFSVKDSHDNAVPYTFVRNPDHTITITMTELVPDYSGDISLTATYDCPNTGYSATTSDPYIIPDLSVYNAEITVTADDGFASVPVKVTFVSTITNDTYTTTIDDNSAPMEIPPGPYHIYVSGEDLLLAHLVICDRNFDIDLIQTKRDNGKKDERRYMRYLP